MTRDNEVLSLRIRSKRFPRLIEAARHFAHRLLGMTEFNQLYSRLPPCAPVDFQRTVLDALQVRVEAVGQPLKSIPATGPLVVVANHPFGLIEGIALDVMLQSVRPDFRLMAVHRLAAIPEFRDRGIFVGPRGSGRHRKHSVRGWRQAIQWVAGGGVLGVFPAGNAARLRWRSLSVRDAPWSPHVAALIRRTGAAVLPVHFTGRNSWIFQITGILCPPLADLRLAGEIVNKQGLTLHATVGRLVRSDELSNFATDKQRIEFLRRETEALARPR